MSHIAYLTGQQLTETKREQRGEGILLVSGVPSDSKTEQGIRYEFDPACFTDAEAQAWITSSGIHCTSWKLEESKPRRRFWFEASKVGRWHASNDGSGKPGFVELTREKLEMAARSVKAGLVKAKNKLTHAADQRMAHEMFGDMGDIVDARMRADGVLELETDVPEGVALAIESELLRERSIEIDPETNNLIACAWLGFSRPAVKGLARVALSESSPIAPPALVIGGQVIECEEAEPASGSPGATDGNEPKPEEIPPAQEPDSAKENEMATIEELTAQLEAERNARKADREGRIDSFLAFAVGKHLTPAQVPGQKLIAMSLPSDSLPAWEEMVKASTVPNLTQPVGDARPYSGTQSAIPPRAQRLLAFAEGVKKQGRSIEESPAIVRSESEAILLSETEDIRKETGMSYADSLKEAGKRNPDLVAGWREPYMLGARREV